MSDVLSSITGGIARFALAWLLPTSVAVGLFWGLCVPDLEAALLDGNGPGGDRGPFESAAVATFVAVSIAVVLAYSSQLLYRILEGYHLPSALDRWMTNRQVTRRDRHRAVVNALGRHAQGRGSKMYGLALEQLQMYPSDDTKILPTRLGNALKALETYGLDVYGMDAQLMWYELIGTAEESVRRECEEARGQVDLFVAALVVAGGLATAAFGVAIAAGTSRSPLVLAVASCAFVPIAYRGAVRNMKEWQNSVRALVNLGRWRVADGMGLVLPWQLVDERQMWQSVSGIVHYRDTRHAPWLDFFRKGTPYEVERGVVFGESLTEASAEADGQTPGSWETPRH